MLGIHKDIVFKRREGETATWSILSCVTLDVVSSDTGHCNQSDRDQDMAALTLCNQLSGHGSQCQCAISHQNMAVLPLCNQT